jgi:hypothetical protein
MQNGGMTIHGRVKNGVVVLENGPVLPDGTQVTVSYQPARPGSQSKGKPVRFPLVHSKKPGSVHLTGERIAEILDEEDASS